MAGRQNPLLQKAFNDGATDLECCGRLLQGQPCPRFLIVGQTPLIPYIIYMMDTPRLSLSCPIAQAIEHLGDQLGITDFGQLLNQFEGFVVGDAPVVTGAIARHSYLRVHPAFPVEVQEFLRGLFDPVDDNFFEHCAQDPFF